MSDRAALVASLDLPGHLTNVLGPGAGQDSRGGLAGATVVFLAAPQAPALASRLQHRYRAAAPQADFEQAALTARHRGAARVIAVSTVFCYGTVSDPGPDPLSSAKPAAEIASAAAAERGARRFSSLGGDAVILRLGWAYSREDAITRQVLAAARRGWQLIGGEPAAWLAMIAESDAARAVLPALILPPGTYDVTDGRPFTQAALNASLAAAAGTTLHPLDDPYWGHRGILFGHSRHITGHAFRDLTGWQPEAPHAPESLASLLSTKARRSRHPRTAGLLTAGHEHIAAEIPDSEDSAGPQSLAAGPDDPR